MMNLLYTTCRQLEINLGTSSFGNEIVRCNASFIVLGALSAISEMGDEVYVLPLCLQSAFVATFAWFDEQTAFLLDHYTIFQSAEICMCGHIPSKIRSCKLVQHSTSEHA